MKLRMLKILALGLLLVCGAAYASEQPSSVPTKAGQPQKTYVPQAEQVGNQQHPITDNVPLSVTIKNPITVEHSKSERDEDRKEAKKEASYDRSIAYGTEFLAGATVLLAIITFFLAKYTYRLWRGATEDSSNQRKEVRESIDQAIRSADAMEMVANAAKENALRAEKIWRTQMRAYLTVNVDSGFPQAKMYGIKFEVRPTLWNSGNTPAHNMNYWARAEVMSFPLPDTFDFPAPKETPKRSFVLGPHQTIILNAFVDDFVPDTEVVDIKKGSDKRVYIWGEVTYDDVFGDPHKTRFCHSIAWVGIPPNELVIGTYEGKYNEAT